MLLSIFKKKIIIKINIKILCAYNLYKLFFYQNNKIEIKEKIS
jgi:hypothetical protein